MGVADAGWRVAAARLIDRAGPAAHRQGDSRRRAAAVGRRYPDDDVIGGQC